MPITSIIKLTSLNLIMSFSPIESLYSKTEKLYRREHSRTLVKVYNTSMLYIFGRVLVVYHFLQEERSSRAEWYRLHYDHLCTVLFNTGLTQRDLLLSALPMVLFFGFAFNHTLTGISDRHLWRAIHYLVQETVGDFFAANSDVKVLRNVHLCNLHRNALQKLFSVLHLLIRRPQQVKFGHTVSSQQQVTPFQAVSRRLKCQIVRFWVGLEVATQLLYFSSEFFCLFVSFKTFLTLNYFVVLSSLHLHHLHYPPLRQCPLHPGEQPHPLH